MFLAGTELRKYALIESQKCVDIWKGAVAVTNPATRSPFNFTKLQSAIEPKYGQEPHPAHAYAPLYRCKGYELEKEFVVALSGTLEYIAAEIIELSGNAARVRVTRLCMCMCVCIVCSVCV